MATIELTGINKSFGPTAVLRDIDLSVDDGEFVVLVGPSGCGKSTLLRILAGLEQVDTSDVMIDRRRANDLAPARRGVAMVFQSYALYPRMSVRENMAFGLQAGRREPRGDRRQGEGAAAALLEIGPLLDRRPKALSGGQRQRVAIGRAIVREPSVFLFDEPLSTSTPSCACACATSCEAAPAAQVRPPSTSPTTRSRPLTLADGSRSSTAAEVVQFGTAEALYERPATQFVAGFIGSPRMSMLGGAIEAVEGGGAIVQLRNGAALRAAVVARPESAPAIRSRSASARGPERRGGAAGGDH